MPKPWVYGSMFAISLLYLLALLYFYRARTRRTSLSVVGDDTSEPADGHIEGDTETVACPDCGTENEPGYRFCRSCVGELPGAVAPKRRASVPNTRGML